jgi:hypothetical protein
MMNESISQLLDKMQAAASSGEGEAVSGQAGGGVQLLPC